MAWAAADLCWREVRRVIYRLRFCNRVGVDGYKFYGCRERYWGVNHDMREGNAARYRVSSAPEGERLRLQERCSRTHCVGRMMVAGSR